MKTTASTTDVKKRRDKDPRRRVTPAVVAELRRRFADGEGITTIARDLDVEEGNALRIAKGEAWKREPMVDLSRRLLRRHPQSGAAHPLHGRSELRPRGEEHPAAKLTDEAVREIRRRASEPLVVLAQEFGVVPRTIAAAQARVTWRHI